MTPLLTELSPTTAAPAATSEHFGALVLVDRVTLRLVLLLNASANRDEKHFLDPDRWHPPQGSTFELRTRLAFLPRLIAGSAGSADRVRGGVQAVGQLGR